MGLFGWIKRLAGGGGHGIDVLAKRLGISADALQRVSPVYRAVTIPKRSGGTRTLLIPSADLKHLQRKLLRRVLGGLSAHPAAQGFERGASIVTHAARHTGRDTLIRLDIVSFFDTTRADRVEAYYRAIGWSRPAAALLTHLTTHNGALPQGAPTSPRLSNLVNHRMDARIFAMVESRAGRDATYSRYADDITISLPRHDRALVRQIIGNASRIVREEGYALHARKKRAVLRPHHRQLVTGLVVNKAVSLPRARRRWLRAVEHRLATGQEATITEAQLQGWKSLQRMIETQRG